MKMLTNRLLLAILILSLMGCSNGSKSDTNGGNNQSDVKEATLNVFNFKVEMSEQLDQLVKRYESEHPEVNIVIETCGGGCDYSTALKTKFSSGDKPDIFFVAGFNDLNVWFDHLEDLSNQPWVKDIADIAKEPMTKEGKVYGMPLNIEGWGYIYNKELFQQAGITKLPKTLSELRSAAKQLDESGITPFINGYGEWLILGNHLLNIAFAQQDNPEEYIDSLKKGNESIPNNKTFNDWVHLLDLTLEYGQPNPLQTDYNTQVTSFAAGQAAMIQQGNWIQLQLLKLHPDMEYGFLPMPINDDKEAMDRLPIGVPNYWVVHKKSKVKEEAKEFLNWMVTSEIGKRYIVEEFKFIPALKTIAPDKDKLGPLAADLLEYIENDKTIPWLWQRYPGYEVNTSQMASVMQAYISHEITKEEMLTQFQRIWDERSEEES
ncbi:ABC transporter substrate-binding protein [Mesobacillus foraminis]|uniref:Raffinose/stachyose/melibiose transport system substrate-binding protein n=1 Tax=Mesobacillus foraminis TaxID=279826 RepID=A0A4R2BIN9_9BACI|nr:ABC transporter substrate-binding protein [Mesobacillus foraminis]TCN26292.1 raffinose/stachyose/melibiose transport system substrate-binding protein [Mesobacillus foraminis]